MRLIYHGLDFACFPRFTGHRPKRDGNDPRDPVIVLSIGRAVEKKGHDILIGGLARLPTHLNWRLVHIGGGPLRAGLKRLARRAGIGARIDWLGVHPQQEVLDHCRKADLFVLANRIAWDGDRDGLPNVLMEAQSQGLPCIASHVSAILELIADGTTGTLVAPEDEAALSEPLEALIADPARRLELGASGEDWVRLEFSSAAGIAALADIFGLEQPARTGGAPAGTKGDEIMDEVRAAGA